MSKRPRSGASDSPDRGRGVVVRDEGSRLIVDAGGREFACTVRKSLRRRAGRGTKAVAVGDRVEFEIGGEGAAVTAVEPRSSCISRPDPGRPRREQVLVANLEAVLVVASARRPEFVAGLVDRFLVAAESRGLDVVLAVNKIDLDPDAEYESRAGVYRQLGYPVVAVSAATGAGLDRLRELLAGKTTTMLGHSGVGKSSLANALDPSLRLRVGDVHAASGRGLHTTTTVSLLRLPWGGYLVDTPGIREFGLWQVEPSDLSLWFREMAERADACRFNDCLHEAEPGCAVKAAVESGVIVRWRYDSYLRILEAVRAGRDATD